MREEEEMGSSQSSGAVPSSPQEATRDSGRPHWEDRYDALHAPGKPMPGPWTWELHDHSMATLCGGGEDAIVGHIMSVAPCSACAKRAEPKEWVWGRCTTPSEANARLIAAAPDMLEALGEVEAVMTFVVPRSETKAYIAALMKARTAIAKATGTEA